MLCAKELSSVFSLYDIGSFARYKPKAANANIETLCFNKDPQRFYLWLWYLELKDAKATWLK
jgi:hypothetical protein